MNDEPEIGLASTAEVMMHSTSTDTEGALGGSIISEKCINDVSLVSVAYTGEFMGWRG